MISLEHFAERWLIIPEEMPLLAGRPAHSRLGSALLLKFFQENGRFPSNREEIDEEGVALAIRKYC